MYTSLSLAVASRPTRSLSSLFPPFVSFSFRPNGTNLPLVPLIPCPVASFSCPSPCIDSSSSFSSSLFARKIHERGELGSRGCSFTRETMLRSSLRVPFQDDGREKNEITIREREVYAWSMLSQSSLLISLNRRFNLGARMTRNRRSGLK